MFFLGNFFYVLVLLINAIAILSEDRFLARIGWSSTSSSNSFGGAPESESIQAKIIHLIASVRMLMRIPLMIINTMIIIYELVLG
ncbi:hypothetical protein jhhlp_007755 [Lomentospora prolificans]|uniref:Yos1-like protein n=1 Tax=Lomentospora prolificans TaxID=41688 RepID=A0A2N3N0I8_9PEZI|nr:hypothetical protein jhhlp_007755 [Lomentospora prolificans]